MKIVHSSEFIVHSLFLALLLLFSVHNAEAQGIFKIDSIPAPPQSTRLEETKERTNINQMELVANITHYQSPLSPDLIVGFYQQHLPQRGWELLGKESQGQVAMAAFHKDRESVGINAYAISEGTTDIYISRSKSPELTSVPEIKAGEDAPGKDLPHAPRYPGALRNLYQQNKQTGVITVNYSVDAQPQEIIDFYQRKMLDNGWRFQKDIKLAQIPGIGKGTFTTLFFKGAQGRCQISINRADDFQGLESTAVLVNYMPGSALGRMR